MRLRLLTLLWLLIAGSHAALAQHAFTFVKNDGQWPEHVVARAELGGGQLWVENQALRWHFIDLAPVAQVHGSNLNPNDFPNDTRLSGHVYEVAFQNSQMPQVQFSLPSTTRFNFFIGSDQRHWRGNVAGYEEIILKDLYPNIDLKLYTLDMVLKYDLILHPGARYSDVALVYSGMESLRLEDQRLIVQTSVNAVVEQAPVAWQIKNERNVPVGCHYNLKENTLTFGFKEQPNPKWTTVIDPALIFSTYSGSTADNFGYTATYDDEGYLYSGSSAFGNGYPVTLGAYQQTWAGGDGQGALVGTDIALTKYDVSGTFRVYSTYLGGSNDELPHSLIVNSAGELIVMGTTSSPDYPTTANAFSSVFNGGSAFAPSGVGTSYVNGSDIVVTKFSADGSALTGSTFLGGSGNDGVNTGSVLKFNYADEFRGEVDLDDQGNVFVVSSTRSLDFPEVNPIQTGGAATQYGSITRFTPDLGDITFSTRVGMSGFVSLNSMDIAPDGSLLVAGGLTSTYQGLPGSLYPNYIGGTADGVILKILPDLSGFDVITHFGSTTYDQLYFVETDGDGNVYVYGQTNAPGSELIINADYGVPNSGMLVSKLAPDLSAIIWSTVFGTGEGEPNMSPTAFLVDVCRKIYLSGWGGSTNTSSNPATDNLFGMPTTPDAYQSTTNGSDFYLMILEDDASEVVYASFFGGGQSAEHVDGGTSRFNRKGVVYQSVCAGCGSNDDFPIFPPNAVSPTNNSSNCNNGVFKFDFDLPITIADFLVPPVGCINAPVQFQNTSELAMNFTWNFGDGSTSPLTNPIHTYDEPGIYAVTLVASHPASCNLTDSLVKYIEIIEPQVQQLNDLPMCAGATVLLGPDELVPGASYQWQPADLVDNPTSPTTTASSDDDTLFTLTVQSGIGCVDTLFQFVDVQTIDIEVPSNIVLCDAPASVDLTALSPQTGVSWIWSENADLSDPINDGPTDNSVSVEVSGATTFFVGASLGGCSEVEEVSISFISEALAIVPVATMCAGDTITINLLNPVPGFTLDWTPDAWILSGDGTQSITAVVPDLTTFTVTANDGAGCVFSASVNVDVSGLALSDIDATGEPSLMREGEEAVLSAFPEGFEYIWSPSESLSASTGQTVIATPEETTVYYVQVLDGECVYLDSIEIRVYDFVCGPPMIYVPNAFTPNGDDNNDRIFVHGNYISHLSFVIYDRWGEKVFETEELNVGWDGTYKGRPVDPAVFVYYLEAICEDGQQYFEKGNITVIR